MNTGFPSRTWLVGLGTIVGVAGAMALLPRARSTVTAQAAAAVGRRPAWLRAVHDGGNKRMKRAVDAAPGDADLAIGWTFLEQPSPAGHSISDPLPVPLKADLLLSRLAAVAGRFPQNAAVRAHLLRHSLREAGLIRSEERNVSAFQPDGPPGLPPLASDPTMASRRKQTLQRFRKAVAEGQRLEPENGFFDSMQAVAAISIGSASEALRDLHATAGKPHWNDYAAEEPRAQWKLLRASYGDCGALQTSESAYGLLFPHFAPLRAVARGAVRRADELSRRGDHAAAIAIRGDVMRLGLHMDAEQPTLIGKLVGRALFELGSAAAELPARSPSPSPSSRDGAQRKREKRHRYAAYLAAHGAESEATWVREQGERIDARYARIERALAQPGLDAVMFDARFRVWWTIGLMLWKQALALILLWAAAGVLARLRRGDRGQRPRILDMAWLVVGLGLLLGPLCLVAPLGTVPFLVGSLVLGTVLAGSLALAVSAGRRRTAFVSNASQRDETSAWPLWQPALVALVGMLPTIAVFIFVCARMADSGGPWRIELPLGPLVDTLSQFFKTGKMAPELGSSLRAIGFLPVGIISFLMLCRVAVLGQPVVSGLAHAACRVVPPALAMLAVLYLAVLAPTIAADRAVEYQVERFLTDEASFLLDRAQV